MPNLALSSLHSRGLRILKSLALPTSLGFFLSPLFVQGQPIPAKPTTYSYVDSFTCREPLESQGERISWSALARHAVGPSQGEAFSTPRQKILRPFFSDGCSLSPDGLTGTSRDQVWVQCCVQHDVAYWLGGTSDEKTQADELFHNCISAHGFPRVATLYRSAVGTFGGPANTQTFRWGYGWNYQRSFQPLTESERQQAYRLYGVTSWEDLRKKLSSTTRVLENLCHSTDLSLLGYTDEDVRIFQTLNARLKRETQIEWIYLGDFNRFRRIYILKLKNCDRTLELELDTARSAAPRIVGTCPGVLEN